MAAVKKAPDKSGKRGFHQSPVLSSSANAIEVIEPTTTR